MAREDRERWNWRYADEPEVGEASPFLRSLDVLPETGRALDVAGGTGRNALSLAERGLEVTLVDISDVALEIARAEARRRGVEIETLRLDLESDPLPEGPWDVVLCFHYLDRELFRRLPALLVPGGLLVVAVATVSNLERHERPPRQYLVDHGELPTLFAGVEPIAYAEGWFDDHHEARLVARRLGVR